ncbi:MAG TPA: phage major capsid protein, partial [Polyangiaceae bacterium]|nr:phage major capsid protein [Polyangiaceae bacterium]
MAFTAGEIASIANASLDYYFNKGGQFDQSIQNKPLLNMLETRKKTFPGGKGNISMAIVGQYGDGSGNDVVKGYTHNDAVGFFTPANIKRANYPWREHHIGLTLTHTELKIDGISVVDTNGERTAEHSKRELTVLVNLLEQKLFSLGEQYARTMNGLMWGDGTTDAKALAGMRSIIKDNPCVGTTGGLDQTAATGFTWWRNRAWTAAMLAQIGTTPGDAISGGGPVTSDPANGGALLQKLQHEYFQLIRYGGKPTVALAGSSFIDAMMIERRANGFYTMTGFSNSQDISSGDIILPGGTKVQYDPTLDDLGYAKRMYWFDPKCIFLMAMEDEWRK